VAAAALNGRVYVFGGSDDLGSDAITNVDMFNPRGNFWTSAANMPQRRSYAAAASIGNTGYVAGGWYRRALDFLGMWVSLSEVGKFEGKAWSTFGTGMNTKRVFHGLAVAHDGRGPALWAVGGNDASNWLASAETMNPLDGTWSYIASMHVARDE